MTYTYGSSLPSRPADQKTVDLLDLIDADPIHDADRSAVLAAIQHVARGNEGIVDPNLVRRRIPSWVNPKVIGATYSKLTRSKVLAVDGWIVNQDRQGGNYGKPTRRYRWVREGA